MKAKILQCHQSQRELGGGECGPGSHVQCFGGKDGARAWGSRKAWWPQPLESSHEGYFIRMGMVRKKPDEEAGSVA